MGDRHPVEAGKVGQTAKEAAPGKKHPDKGSKT